MKQPVVIVGAGVSGLACAYFLEQMDIPSVLIEKSQPGGLIRTDRVDGCDLEAGPDSFLAAKTSVIALAQSLGIADQLIPSNDAQRRILIARGNKLVRIPKGMVLFAPTDLRAALTSSFFSTRAKLSFLREIAFRPKQRVGDVDIRSFVAEHFCDEVAANIAEPLLSGVYGGSAAHLSAVSVLPRFVEAEKSTGSLIRAFRKERLKQEPGKSVFLSFANGMQTLIDALRKKISAPIVQTEAISVDRHWRVRTEAGDYEAEHVVIATPAHVAGRLLAETLPAEANFLTTIPYSSAILATFLFDAADFDARLDAFGFLVPEAERTTIAAATWINTKFPSRISEGRVGIRAFIVSEQAVRLANATDDEIAERSLADLRKFMGFGSKPLKTVVVRWPLSMPQYLTGHSEKVRTLFQTLKTAHPGLHLAGNAYYGVGIPDAVRTARAAVAIIGSQ